MFIYSIWIFIYLRKNSLDLILIRLVCNLITFVNNLLKKWKVWFDYERMQCVPNEIYRKISGLIHGFCLKLYALLKK